MSIEPKLESPMLDRCVSTIKLSCCTRWQVDEAQSFSLVTSDKLLVFGGLAYRNQTPGLLCRNSVSQYPQVNAQMGFPKDYRTWWSNMCPKVPCCPIQNPVYVQTPLNSLQSMIFLDLSLNFSAWTWVFTPELDTSLWKPGSERRWSRNWWEIEKIFF